MEMMGYNFNPAAGTIPCSVLLRAIVSVTFDQPEYKDRHIFRLSISSLLSRCCYSLLSYHFLFSFCFFQKEKLSTFNELRKKRQYYTLGLGFVSLPFSYKSAFLSDAITDIKICMIPRNYQVLPYDKLYFVFGHYSYLITIFYGTYGWSINTVKV